MFLTGCGIAEAVDQRALVIRPFQRRHLRPLSVRITLGDHAFRLSEHSAGPFRISEDKPEGLLAEYASVGGGFTLTPSLFILAESAETLSLPYPYFGLLSTLSSLARIGIESIRSSMLVQPGFGVPEAETLALELHSLAPRDLWIPVGFPVAQLMIGRLPNGSSPADAEASYSSTIGIQPDFSHLRCRGDAE